MYIAYRTSNGKTYAYLAECNRDGQQIEKKYLGNLGRVLDKENGIYRNRERGVFIYDLATGAYGTAPADFIEPPKRKQGKYLNVAGKKRSRLCLEFGNSFFLDTFLMNAGFYQVIDAVGYGNTDTLRVLVFYYLLSQQPNSHAADWYELNYVKTLFPNAAVFSQRISEALAEIGTQESKRGFFSAYYSFIKKRGRKDPKQKDAKNANAFCDGDDGVNLSVIAEPDHAEYHMHPDCSLCPYHDRCLVKACIRETRHEIDAEVSVNITAHELVVVGSCPLHGGERAGVFPSGIKATVQYGKNLQTMVVAFNTVGAVSVSRTHEILGSVFNIPLSLENYKASVYLFISKLCVPFNNKQAERNLRMIRVIQQNKQYIRISPRNLLE